MSEALPLDGPPSCPLLCPIGLRQPPPSHSKHLMVMVLMATAVDVPYHIFTIKAVSGQIQGARVSFSPSYHANGTNQAWSGG